MQDPCKFTLNSAAKPLNLFETLSLSLATYRRDLNLNAADFKPQPTRIVPAATRRAILAAHTYRRIFAKFL